MFSCDGSPFIEFSGTAQRAGRLRGASFLVMRCGADVRGGTAVFGPLYSGSVPDSSTFLDIAAMSQLACMFIQVGRGRAESACRTQRHVLSNAGDALCKPFQPRTKNV